MCYIMWSLYHTFRRAVAQPNVELAAKLNRGDYVSRPHCTQRDGHFTNGLMLARTLQCCPVHTAMYKHIHMYIICI
jgi:hypothetical protein